MKIQKVKDAVKKYPRITIVLMMMLLVGTGLGAWLITSSADADITVISEGADTTFSVDFLDLELDTTDAAVSDNTTATLSNADGVRVIKFNAVETVTDVDTDTCDNTGDCNLSYKLDSVAIADGDEVNLQSGDNPVEIFVECRKLSCPSLISTLITVNDLGALPDTTDPVIEILVNTPKGHASGTVSDDQSVTSVELEVRLTSDGSVLMTGEPCDFDNVAGTFSCDVTFTGGEFVDLEVDAYDEAGNNGRDINDNVNWN